MVSGKTTLYLIVGAIILILAAISLLLYFGSIDYVTGTIKEKWMKSAGDSGMKYLFSVDWGNGNLEVIENTDALFFLKFNSSDIYANLQAGQTAKFKVVGWRIPFMSWYRNIISFEKGVVE